MPAPGRPPGHVVLGYDEHGRCPMLVDDACAIYAHRPRTCRTYDCRVFAATPVTIDDLDAEGRVAIAARARRWRFSAPEAADREAAAAIRAAGRYLDAHPELVPATATSHAVLAVVLHDLFLDADADPDPAAVRARLAAVR